MNSLSKLGKGLALAAVCSIAINPVAASTPNDLSDLVGARAASGESQLQSRGYSLHHASQGDDKIFTYWWNGGSKKCVRVTTEDGRYSNIKSENNVECGQKSGGDGTAAAVIGAAAILGVAALASKSHNREDRYKDANTTAEYERGFRDGLYNQSYHNYGRSNAYTDGYEAGTRQREYETSYRNGNQYGGYNSFVYVNDLIGRSSSDARSQLQSRGFALIETNERNDGKYRTYWRAQSEQCVVMHTRDTYVRSIDSVRKRNCR